MKFGIRLSVNYIQRRYTQKRRKEPFENVVMSARYSRNFFRQGHPNLPYFQAFFFWSRIILKHIENKKGSRGVWGHVLLEFFSTF